MDIAGFRIGLNVTASNVIDVGYAGVIGADRIAHADARPIRTGGGWGSLGRITVRSGSTTGGGGGAGSPAPPGVLLDGESSVMGSI